MKDKPSSSESSPDVSVPKNLLEHIKLLRKGAIIFLPIRHQP